MGLLNISLDVIVGAIGSIVAAEIFLAAPSIARHLVRRAANMLPPGRAARERFAEEWLFILEDLESPTGKLYFALCVLIKAPCIRYYCKYPNGSFSTSIVKELSDRGVAAIIIFMIAPVLAMIAIAISVESPGPILFRQKRSGLNNEIFEAYKFRTMVVSRPIDPAATQATRNDPRLTRFGRFLRRTSLDELPQLWNVLAGQMSLVGPRPQPIPHNDYYGKHITGYSDRHAVKPGLTGLAQINGYRRDNVDTLEQMKTAVGYDLEYIKRWSLLQDLKILCVTVERSLAVSFGLAWHFLTSLTRQP